MNYLNRIYNKLNRILIPPKKKYDETGERVDINYDAQVNFESLDMYQKSHYRRYEYARSLVNANDKCGDFACGTGYGSVMLSEKVKQVIGADINREVINGIKKRYSKWKGVEFVNANLLALKYDSFFDKIISFETLEHFTEENLQSLLISFRKALLPGGSLIFSVPYKQERSEAALKLGHHLTFDIDEHKIENWLVNARFKIEEVMYQNYETHTIQPELTKKDFILCVASAQ